jgi:putative ABC transport system permease protein
MTRIFRELRESVRVFPRQPGFSSIVVLTIALGIGANTAIFSLIYGILLRPFPYREPDGLVRVQSVLTKAGGVVRPCSLADVDDIRKRNRTLVDLGAFSGSFDADIRGDGPAEPIKLNQLQPQALSILGITPVVGRLFLPEEDRPGGDVHKALIGYRLWQDRFSGDPNIAGRTIQTNQTTLTIVGVMPPGFGFPTQTDVWTPMESYYAVGGSTNKRRDARAYSTIARLKPGVTIQQAQADLESVAAGLEQEYPKENFGVGLRLVPLRDAEVGNIRPYLILLLSAVAFVLLICCANVANLLLARGAVREREIAIRAALGAGRGTLLRAHLTESMVLGVAGGLLGIVFAFAGVRALLGLIPVTLPFWMKIEVNGVVLTFALATSLVTSFLFGLIPALTATRTNLQALIKEGTRGSSARSSRLRGALVIAEIALSVVLLIGAGLMMQTFLRLHAMNPGFHPEDLLIVRVTKFQNGNRAERAAVMSGFHERVLASLRAIPGVISAAAVSGVPYTSGQDERRKADLLIKGRSNEELKQLAPVSGADASAGYLETMQIPLLRGRYFDQRDTPSSQMVVIVSERTAKTLWPGMDPIGREIFWGAGTPTPENPYCTVVGVVGNVRYNAAEADNGLELYYPYTQYPVSNVYYLLRTRMSAGRINQDARTVIRAIDQNAPIVWTKSMEQIMDESLWQRRLWGVLFAVFAGLALVLAAIGIYGVMSYMVSQRTREIGIRVALGASRASVLRLVIRNGFGLVIVGLVGGVGAALALSQLVRSLLFGVTPTDRATFAGVPCLLAVVALVACYVPARSAASVDPLTALRQE